MAAPCKRLACISRTRHARSVRVARNWGKSHSRLHFALSARTISAEGWPATNQLHSRLHFAHSTRTISAAGCPRQSQIALSPAFRALDTDDPQRVGRDKTIRTAAKAYVLSHQAGTTARGMVCFCFQCLCHIMPVKGGCLPRAGAKAPVLVPCRTALGLGEFRMKLLVEGVRIWSFGGKQLYPRWFFFFF